MSEYKTTPIPVQVPKVEGAESIDFSRNQNNDTEIIKKNLPDSWVQKMLDNPSGLNVQPHTK